MDASEFTAAGIRARLQRQRDEKLAAAREQQQAHEANQGSLREAFEKVQLPADAMQRVIKLVERAIKDGLKEAQVYRFSSDFMKDDGRSLTSQYGDWTRELTGGAARAYEFFQRELEPNGFLLRARIVEYKEGIPADAALFLAWEEPKA